MAHLSGGGFAGGGFGLEGAVEDMPIAAVLNGLTKRTRIETVRFHIEMYGVTTDGRLFRTATGGRYSPSAYYRAWRQARTYALRPDVVQGPLAGRPYDLRHAGVTFWLNAGVPATEVAKRAGHGVGVLLRIYAGCIDGGEITANDQITKALEP